MVTANLPTSDDLQPQCGEENYAAAMISIGVGNTLHGEPKSKKIYRFNPVADGRIYR